MERSHPIDAKGAERAQRKGDPRKRSPASLGISDPHQQLQSVTLSANGPARAGGDRRTGAQGSCGRSARRHLNPGAPQDPGMPAPGTWARRDLNSRPPGYQPGAPAGLSYGPEWRRRWFVSYKGIGLPPPSPSGPWGRRLVAPQTRGRGREAEKGYRRRLLGEGCT